MAIESRNNHPMDRIAHLLQAGQIAEAELFCRDYLTAHVDDVNVLGMLGAILLKQRRFDEAEALLKRTIELAPTFAKPHEDLGMLYMSRDNAQQAVPCLQRAIELDHQLANAYFSLAHALAKTGREQEAQAVHKKYLALSPTAQTIAEAAALLERGETEQAEACCQRLLDRDPDNIEALRMLARIASDDQRYVIAEGLLRRIIKVAPGSFRHHLDFGRFLAERSRFPEVVEVCDRAISIDPDNADIHLLRADALSVIGRATEALGSFDRCLTLRPDDPQALVGRGQLLRVIGQRAEAIACFERCISLRPTVGDAWWSLASLRGYAFDEQQHEHMLSMFDGRELDARNETYFRFALSRAFEERGDFDRAWDELLAGNKAKRALVSYDPVETESQHDKLIEVFSQEFMRRKRPSSTTGVTPIFILGMPRSGSTLIEQILASHSAVEGTGELPYILMISNALGGSRPDQRRYPEVLRDMSDEQLASLGLSYLHHAQNHLNENSAYFTDKMPRNFSHAGFISLILPGARIIDARRNSLDTCVGNFRQLYATGKNQTYDLQELGEYYLQYIRIMDHWNAVMPDRILTVHYEQVVNDLELQVRRILDYCGLPWEDTCLDFHRSTRVVNTASSEQVRQPIYKDAVGFWKNYEPHLAELIEILAPVSH